MKAILKFKVTFRTDEGKLIESKFCFGKKDLNVVIASFINEFDLCNITIEKRGFASDSDILAYQLSDKFNNQL